MQVSRLCLAAFLIAVIKSGTRRCRCWSRPGNLSGAMLGLSFQPTRRERDRPFACRRSGRKAGSLSGFHFTPALQGSGLTWNADTFIQFLADPSKLVPGTAMTVMVTDATGRANLFAYLATLKDTTAATKPSGPAARKITGPTQAELNEAAAATETWLYASHDYAGSRFVDFKEITPANAKNLRPVCLYRSEQPASVQTSPLVYGGVMYLTFGRATVAIDAKTCRERWTYIWQPKGQEISPANRGAAIKDGTTRPRYGRRLSDRPRYGRRLPSVEPTDRERSGRPISVACRRSSSPTSSSSGLRVPISAPRTGSAPSSSRPAIRCGNSISFQIPASPELKPGRIKRH